MTARGKRAAVRRTRRHKPVAPDAPPSSGYLLRLYISGASPRSTRAIANIKRICESHGGQMYALEVIDIHQQPELAREAQLVAAPTLLKREPPPERRLVGDLSDDARVLAGLGLRPRET